MRTCRARFSPTIRCIASPGIWTSYYGDCRALYETDDRSWVDHLACFSLRFGEESRIGISKRIIKMALKLPQPKDYRSAPIEDVELTKSIRATLARLDASAENLGE